MKTNKIYILLIALVLGLASCSEDFLETEPTTAISAESVFEDTLKINAFMNGIYDLEQYWYYTNHTLMASDMRGNDLFVKSTGNYNRYVVDYQFSILPTYWTCTEIWRYAYKIIAAANQATYYMPGTSFSDTYKNGVIAEARALRAQAYLTMMHFFAWPYTLDPNSPGVAIATEPVNPDPASSWPSRGTVAEAYDLIIEDLTFAAANFPASKTAVGKMNINAVHGFLARAYLDMGDWENARDHAVLARAGKPLSSSASLLAGFVDPTSEWIYMSDMRADDNNGYLMLPSFYDTRVLGYSSFRATPEFYALFEAADVRRNQFGAVNAGGNTITKYLHRTAWDMDQVLMRSSEMYLIEAEARAHITGEEDEALTALQAIQTRAGATLTPDGTTGQALLDAIALERRKELFGEGFIMWDIIRRGEPLVRTSAAHWAQVNLTAYDPRMLYPIPQDEIDANPNINESDQNEGY